MVRPLCLKAQLSIMDPPSLGIQWIYSCVQSLMEPSVFQKTLQIQVPPGDSLDELVED